MKNHLAFVEQMVAQGGPNPAEYDQFTDWLHEIASETSAGKLTNHDIQRLRLTFGEALSCMTLQGFAYVKPRGYPGDFEMLEKIYLKFITSQPMLKNWDLYFQAQRAPQAVRNRKEYFKQVLRSLENIHDNGAFSVLNVASGSARDLSEFLSENSNGRLAFDCVEWDNNAISLARNLCGGFSSIVNFFQGNALRFTSPKCYRLIWSAGLFDYLDDAKFKFLLKRLWRHLDESGELIIGNFSEDNPTRNYMEIVGDWILNHRSPEKLRQLALECGINQNDIRIGWESEGINLFLHVKRGDNFLHI